MQGIEEILSRTTDTRAIAVGAGILPQVADMFRRLFPREKAKIIADVNTWRAAGNDVHRILLDAEIPQDEPYIFADPDLHGEWKFVERLDGILAKTDAVAVAVGSGVINDLTKLCSHHNGRQYLIIGTAASVDGYTSYGASITKDGNKQTFSCPAPLGGVFDSEVIAAAPKELAASGYADLLAKIPGGADWMLADTVGTEKLVDYAFAMVQDGLRTATDDAEGVRSGNVAKVERLVEGLLLSGFAMQAIQSSRPASGAEHMFSHLWDMEHLTVDGHTISHGFQVGIGTLATTAFYELMLRTPVEDVDVDACVAAWKSWEETEEDIRRLFAGHPDLIARGLTETKAKYVDKEGLRAQIEMIRTAWPTLKGRLQKQIMPFEEMREKLRLVGAPYEPEQIGLSRERLRDSYRKIPYMRARYSILDVAFRCGWLEGWLDILFGKGGRWEIA
ncbi:MAG: sn-glycerol-1-phosphate dehydrogenase [Bacteroidales bacterium]|nr:sn-glycerol-1-phosphate dehydrogenase [Bacteroidales bacterium]